MDMEAKVKQIMSQYRKRKWAGFAIVALDIVYLVYLVIFKMDVEINYVVGGFAALLLMLDVFIVYAVIAVAAVVLIASGGAKIDAVLYQMCDPYLYEECLNRMHVWRYKDRFACLHGMAQYYQGNIDKAEETFRGIHIYNLRGVVKVNYYLLMSAIYFKRGMGQRVTELEQAYRASMKKTKREQLYFQTLCASNNLYRAMENKDYQSAFLFLEERKELDRKQTAKWIRIGYHLWEGKIYAAIGDKNSARMHLNYVIKEGGRLVHVSQARELLEELGHEKKMCFENE